MAVTDLVGTPAQIVEHMHAFADVGIDLFLIQCSPPMCEELERIGTQVLPLLNR